MSVDEAKLWNTVMRHEFQNELRHLKTRQGQFDAAMLHFDHPLPGGTRLLLPSDGGAGADRIYAACEALPLWQRLWVNAYAKLPSRGKAVLNALKADWRTAVAAKAAGVSRPTVDHWKKLFKEFFAQCFQAWERDFGGK